MIRSPDHSYDATAPRRGTAGGLDVSYGIAGRATAEYPHFGGVGSESIAYASALDGQRRLVIAGHSFDASGALVASLVRFTGGGTPDTGFGMRGFVTLPASVPEGEAWLRQISALADDALLVGFEIRGTRRRQVQLLRLLPCGTADLGFMQDTQGVLALAGGSAIDTLHGMHLRADGHLMVLAGTHRDRVRGPQLVVACVRPDGRLAQDHGDAMLAAGLATLPLPAGLRRRNRWLLAPAPEGGVLCAGDVCDARTLQPAGIVVHRLDAAGRAVDAFGDAGTLCIRHGDEDVVRSLACRDDGRILLTLQSGGVGLVSMPRLLQLLPDGQPDSGFGRGGGTVARLGGAARYQRLQAAYLQADGGVLLAGNPWIQSEGQRVLLARLHPDGSRDDGFGDAGVLCCSFGHATGADAGVNVDSICGVHMAGDRILVAGHQLEYQTRYKFCGLAVHA